MNLSELFSLKLFKIIKENKRYKALLKPETFNVDYVMSLGSFCRTAQALKRNNLRTNASPFDWMMCYELSTVANFFEQGLDNYFIHRSDLHEDKDGFRKIKDEDTGMIAMHHFPTTISVEQFYPEFLETSKRTMERVRSSIERSSTFAFVSYREFNFEDIENFTFRLERKFPNRNLLFFGVFNQSFRSIDCFKVSKNSSIYKIGFPDKTDNVPQDLEWMGNLQEWDFFLKSIKLIKG